MASSYAMNHRPDLVHRRLMEGDLNATLIRLWVGNLVAGMVAMVELVVVDE
ncbi:transmembrane protein, putative [Medicago truncatula]|uniref:Transmembrane protein, putative n=1 Tax=Medicago truncatula TaxID=3880 RepID=A0A072UM08_MEDTR|nr:transmembrane protein, putative [Medicago truncatula]